MKQSENPRTPPDSLNVHADRLKNARLRLHLPHQRARDERRAWDDLLAGSALSHSDAQIPEATLSR
jgi:hypothetical protein